ncbi:unnamed protein product, partial [Arabidopsis halleri]
LLLSFHYIKPLYIFSFKIEVIVDDGDDSATLVIFDQDGSQITGTTAEDIKRNSGEEELKGIPKSLRTIIGETYLFEIKVKEKDFEGSYQSFAVSQ